MLEEGYENKIANDEYSLEKFGHLVSKQRYICDKNNVLSLFGVCDVDNCRKPIVEKKDKKVLEVKWRCKACHVGQCASCEKVNGIYIDNLSSILFTGK